MRKITKRHFTRIRDLFFRRSDILIMFVRIITVVMLCDCCYERAWIRLTVLIPFAVLFLFTPFFEDERNWYWENVESSDLLIEDDRNLM